MKRYCGRDFTDQELAQIHERIEEQFPGRVEVSDLFECPSVTELRAFLESGQAGAK